MAEDYQMRKMAKKKRKREGQDEPAGKRIRKKRNKTRRICRGLCYQDPFEVRQKGQPTADAADATPEDDTEAAPPKPKRRRRNKTDNAVKQSTSINLLAPTQNAASDHPAKSYAGALGALSLYPKAIQEYMLDQGLTGPTPVQERSVSQGLRS